MITQFQLAQGNGNGKTNQVGISQEMLYKLVQEEMMKIKSIPESEVQNEMKYTLEYIIRIGIGYATRNFVPIFFPEVEFDIFLDSKYTLISYLIP